MCMNEIMKSMEKSANDLNIGCSMASILLEKVVVHVFPTPIFIKERQKVISVNCQCCTCLCLSKDRLVLRIANQWLWMKYHQIHQAFLSGAQLAWSWKRVHVVRFIPNGQTHQEQESAEVCGLGPFGG